MFSQSSACLRRNVVRHTSQTSFITSPIVTTFSTKAYKSIEPISSLQSTREQSSLSDIVQQHYQNDSKKVTVQSPTTPSGHIPCKYPVRSHNAYSNRSVHNVGVVKPLDVTVRELFGDVSKNKTSQHSVIYDTTSGKYYFV